VGMANAQGEMKTRDPRSRHKSGISITLTYGSELSFCSSLYAARGRAHFGLRDLLLQN
jgi:hypothetical protein